MSFSGKEIAFIQTRNDWDANKPDDDQPAARSIYWTSDMQSFSSADVKFMKSGSSTIYTVNREPGCQLKPIFTPNGWLFWYRFFPAINSPFSAVGSYFSQDITTYDPKTSPPVITSIEVDIIDVACVSSGSGLYYYYIIRNSNGSIGIRYTTDILSSKADLLTPTYVGISYPSYEADIIENAYRLVVEGTSVYILGQFSVEGQNYGSLSIDFTNSPTFVSYVKNSQIKLNQPSDAIRFSEVKNTADDQFMFGCYFNQNTSTCNSACSLVSSPCYQQISSGINPASDYYSISHIFKNFNSVGFREYFYATFVNKTGDGFTFAYTDSITNPNWNQITNFTVQTRQNVNSPLTFKPVSPIYYYFNDPTGNLFGLFQGSDSKIYLLKSISPDPRLWTVVYYDQQNPSITLLPNSITVRPTIDAIYKFVPTPDDGGGGGGNIDKYFIITVIGLGITIIFAFLAIYVRIIKRLQSTM